MHAIDGVDVADDTSFGTNEDSNGVVGIDADVDFDVDGAFAGRRSFGKLFMAIADSGWLGGRF